MGQKVNPHGFRVGVIKDWNSRWFTKDENFGDTLVSDYKVRKYLKEKYKEAGVPKIEIERDNARVRVFLHCAKPGLVIGRGGAEIEKIRLELEAMVGMPVSVNVVEVKNPDVNAQLVAESIAKQLEGRASFRRAMKMSIQRTMRLGAKGIKVTCSGRLAGAEIANPEQRHRRHAFYLRNGLKDTPTSRTFEGITYTIMSNSNAPFTQQDYDDILSALRAVWLNMPTEK